MPRLGKRCARDMLELAREFGCSVEKTRRNHIRMRHPSGWFVIASAAPGDYRALANARAELRRKARQG